MSSVQSITTAEQLFDAPDLGRCQLLRGELIMMSPAGSEHGMITAEIAGILRDFVKPRSLGVVLGAETGFRVSSNPDTVLAPGVAFIKRERIEGKLPRDFFPGPPDLAVEVLSPNDRAGEAIAKVREWLDAGCKCVWLVDPKTQTVTVYSADRRAVILASADAIVGGELLPGFSTPVSGIFSM